jgi:hypothetical protein
MKKYILTVEFRYHDKPKGEWDHEYPSKKITIGIYDSMDKAVLEGNTIMRALSKHFQVRDGDWFKMVHLFGHPKTLCTNTCYPTKGIEYFAKIDTLVFDDLEATIAEAFTAYERYREYKLSLKED